MIISTAKYLEEIRKAEKRDYKKAAKACAERAWNNEMEKDLNDQFVELRKEIRELRARVEKLSGEAPEKHKCSRHGKGWKVLPIRIDVIKMADKKPEEPEESGEAKEAQGEETEEQGEGTGGVPEAAKQFIKDRFGKKE